MATIAPNPAEIRQPAKPKQETLMVSIISPKREYFRGPAMSVSSINSAGAFDILVNHGNFITLVKEKPIIIRLPDKTVRTFTYSLAVVYAKKNIVTIFTDIHLEIQQ